MNDEYQIDQNTTYTRIGHFHRTDIIKYKNDNNSALIVTFKEDCDHTLPDKFDTHNGSSYPFFQVKVELEKNIEVPQNEKDSETKKRITKTLQKLFTKKQQDENQTQKEVLFEGNRSRKFSESLDDFLQKPIELVSPEYETIAKIIEKARKTIVEVGYPMHEEAIKNNEIKSNKEWEESKQKEAANRRALDNMVKNKIKGFDI